MTQKGGKKEQYSKNKEFHWKTYKILTIVRVKNFNGILIGVFKLGRNQ